LKIYAIMALGCLFFYHPHPRLPHRTDGGMAPNAKVLYRPNVFGDCKMWLTVIQRERVEANMRYLARIRPHDVQPIVDSAYAPPADRRQTQFDREAQ
jgi:hypothetical protein